MPCPRLNVKCFLGFLHFHQNPTFLLCFFVYKDGSSKIFLRKCLQGMDFHALFLYFSRYSVCTGAVSFRALYSLYISSTASRGFATVASVLGKQ